MTTLKTSNNAKEALFNLAYALLDFSAIVAATIFSGWVLSILWSMFITTTFGIVALNVPTAIGIMVVAGYVTKQLSYSSYVENKTEEAQKWHRYMQFVKPAFFLVIGYVVSLFM